MRREYALSNTHSEMSDSVYKHRKMYVDHPNDISKLTCLIHGLGHSSDECRLLGDFNYKYSK